MPVVARIPTQKKRLILPRDRTRPAAANPDGRVLAPPRATADGWKVLTIHWSNVPGYDYETACEGLSPEGIARELEIDWNATEGLRVYPEFGRGKHVALEPLVPNPDETFYTGWDFGGCPAFVIMQFNAFGQLQLFPSCSPPEGLGIHIYDFGQLVAEHLLRRYATPFGKELKELKLIHFGDPAGNARPARTGDRPQETQSCFDILYRGLVLDMGTNEWGEPVKERKPGLGWRIGPGAVNITDRLAAVKGRLTHSLRDGMPALIVCPNADVLISGFQGGYHRPQRADGSYARDPEKNFFSHTFNALEYACTRLFVQPAAEPEDEDEDGGRRVEFRSHAASRYA